MMLGYAVCIQVDTLAAAIAVTNKITFISDLVGLNNFQYPWNCGNYIARLQLRWNPRNFRIPDSWEFHHFLPWLGTKPSCSSISWLTSSNFHLISAHDQGSMSLNLVMIEERLSLRVAFNQKWWAWPWAIATGAGRQDARICFRQVKPSIPVIIEDFIFRITNK